MTPEEAIKQHSGLVYMVANRYRRYCEDMGHFDFDDIEQIGFVGLLKGARNYDPTCGYAPSTFLVYYIRGEILKFFRDHFTSVKMSRRCSLADRYEKGIARSLYEPIPTDDGGLELIDKVSTTEDFSAIHVTEIIDRTLTARQKRVLRMYLSGANQTEIGRKLGVTQVSVWRYLNTIRQKLAAAL